ncbi:dirigent protein 19-like [Dioscorea cayenensis subsp. rotundata]|uniref:Dirigent protein n=1 Tax=Dioscorea cayennensis subsp. rotundata TaxID=55577 RepID=A0AB40CGU0_DIOCR|nr:dirigent protein 19-like [Dioscorea cayenensis subsp. rotundata]
MTHSLTEVPPSAGKAVNVFGEVSVTDDPLAEIPNMSSKLISQPQGINVQPSLQQPALLITLSLAFITKEFNSSSLAYIGRNTYLENVSELPVIGGSSAFRFARGYALAKTNSFNTSSGNAVAEYNVYVMHYQFSLTVFKW